MLCMMLNVTLNMIHKYMPAAFGAYDVWHEKFAYRSKFMSWDGEGCVGF